MKGYNTSNGYMGYLIVLLLPENVIYIGIRC